MSKNLPKSVDQAVARLISELDIKDMIVIAGLEHDELSDLNASYGAYIRNAFRLWSGNDELMQSCRFVSKDKKLNADGASFTIIEVLWERLREMHRLKVVK